MSERGDMMPDRRGRPVPVSYEPPRVEQVLSPADLEREILYAGQDFQTADSDGG